MKSEPKKKQKRTAAKKPGKALKSGKGKDTAKKQGTELRQDERKEAGAVQEQGGNVPEKDGNVLGELSYEKLLSLLTAKRARFVEEYLIDSNGTKAAIRAGYSEHTAVEQASRLLRNVHVMNAVAAGKKAITEKNKDRFEEAMEELRLIAFSDIRNHVTVDQWTGAIQCKGFEDMPDRSSRAIESISEDRVIKESADGTQIVLNDKRKFKLHNKVTALVAYIDRLKPPEPQKIDLTVNGGLTLFPPEPKTMAEYEALVKGGKA